MSMPAGFLVIHAARFSHSALSRLCGCKYKRRWGRSAARLGLLPLRSSGIHGAVLDALTADETLGGRAVAWVAALYLVGEIRVFAFRPAATALDDFKHHHLSFP